MKSIFILLLLPTFSFANAVLYYTDGPKKGQEVVKGTYIGESDICYKGAGYSARDLLDKLLLSDYDKEDANTFYDRYSGVLYYWYTDLQCFQEQGNKEECGVDKKASRCVEERASEKLELLKNLNLKGKLQKLRAGSNENTARLSLKIIEDGYTDEFGRKIELAKYDLKYGDKKYEDCEAYAIIWDDIDDMGPNISSGMILHRIKDSCPYTLELGFDDFNASSNVISTHISVNEDGSTDKIFSGKLKRK